MKRFLVPALACFLFAGCSSPEEQAVDLVGDIADVIEGVTDKESAEEAAKEIGEIVNEMMELYKESDKDMKDIPEDLRKEFAENQERVEKAMGKLSMELKMIIAGALSKMDFKR